MPQRIVKYVRESQSITMRLRLTLWIAAIFTIILWVTTGVFWLYQRSSINLIFNDMLSQRGATLAQQVASNLPGIDRARLDYLAGEVMRTIEFETVVVDVFTASGEHAIRDASPLVDPSTLQIQESLQEPYPLLIPEPRWSPAVHWPDKSRRRAVLVGVVGGDGRYYSVMVATTTRFASQQLSVVRGVLLSVALVAPLLGCLSGWFIAGIAVAPFAALLDLIRQLGPESLGKALVYDTDNAEIQELVAELEDSRQRIREAFAAKERFLSNVSHEIKTPIAVMLVESQTIDLEGQSQEIAYFVSSVKEEMSRLGSLVESFLTLTRLEEGHGKVRGKTYAANDLAMDSVEHCAVMANQAGVWLRPRLFSDEDALDTAVAGDPELLTTMLDNLIRNAIRFSPPQGGVDIALGRDNEWVEFAVRDEGPGIPEDRLETIFDRFAQSGQRRGRGHGLGLAIARGIAELHGGTIRASNLPKGCEFRIILPRVDPL